MDCDYIEFLRCPSCASIQSNSATSGRRRGMPDGAKEAIPLRRNSVFLQGGAISRRDAPTRVAPSVAKPGIGARSNYVDGLPRPQPDQPRQRLGAPPRRDACFRHAPISARDLCQFGLGRQHQLMGWRAQIGRAVGDQVVGHIRGEPIGPLFAVGALQCESY